MNSQNKDDLLDADSYSVSELRSVVFDGSELLSRPLALTLLGLKSYQDKAGDFGRILADDREIPRMRITAAQVLGRIDTEEANSMLIGALTVAPAEVLRSVIEALGRTRSEIALSALEQLPSGRDLSGQTVLNVIEILASRLQRRGEGAFRTQPFDFVNIDPARAVSIDISPAASDQVRSAVRDVTHTVPGLSLTERSATSIRCQGTSMILLFSDWTEEDALATVENVSSEVGVIASLEQIETGTWQVAYHILTRPRGQNSITVAVVTSKGRRILAGVGRLREGQIAFELRTLADAGEVAIEINGTYDGTAVRFTYARSDTRRRSAPEPLPG